MGKTDECLSWVVYRMTIHGKVSGMNAVCEQREWDAMELAQPGHHALIQAGITNEAEAERLARSSPVGSITFKPSVLIAQHAKRIASGAGLDRQRAEAVLNSGEGLDAVKELSVLAKPETTVLQKR